MADKKTTQPMWSKKKRAPEMYRPKSEPREHGSHLTPKGVECTGGGQWGAVSKNPRTGKYTRTRHHSRAMAAKRLDGNRWHTEKHIVDYGDMPAGVLSVTTSVPKKPKQVQKEELPDFGGKSYVEL